MNTELLTPSSLLARHIDACIADVPLWMAAMCNDTRQALQAPGATRSLRGAGGVPLQAAEAALTLDPRRWAERTTELLARR
ncbi:MAG: hypothetical protein RLZZ598_1195 [Pseudomonadota bacterium]|jgi:hypothetical protein